MTDSAETPELQELETLEPMPEPVGDADVRPAAAVGLPPPFYSATAHKEYYRFLFAGVLIFIGSLMPFGPEWEMNGYKTLSGAMFMVIGLGIIWSMWIAIAGGRFKMLWILLAFLPFVVQLLNLIGAWDEPAVKGYVADGKPIVNSWGELFSTAFDRKDPLRGEKVGNFFRAFGTGRVVVFIGALLCELLFLSALFGGAKAAKAQKAAARAVAAERRRR